MQILQLGNRMHISTLLDLEIVQIKKWDGEERESKSQYVQIFYNQNEHIKVNQAIEEVNVTINVDTWDYEVK